MASVTQRVPNYLGGVSKQPDDKKFPGQVKEALNSYPDVTAGLQKRPGFKFLTTLKDGGADEKGTDGTAFSGTTLDNAKWFYIHRDNDEKYIGCIVGNASASSAKIHVWNAATNNKAEVTYTGSSQNYLNSVTKTDYDVLTVQDTSVVTNKTITVTTQSDPTFNDKRQATVRLHGIDYSSPYSVTITPDGGSPQTFTHNTINAENSSWVHSDTDTKLNADTILSALKTLIDAASISNLTVTKLNGSLELTNTTTAFTVTATGGARGSMLTCYQDSVNNVTDLPAESVHDRKVKIINTSNANDTYYAKFVTNAGSGNGPGYWEETLGYGMSPGLTASTMPHELVNTATDVFVFRPITWTARLVGDDTTNSHPTFKDNKIQQAFFYNNRLGFLTEDNVSLSQTGEFYNFYHITAQTLSAADPIDLSCSSIRPAVLHGVIPVASGLLLFSERQQFIMFAADGNLTPQTALIRGLSNYEMDTKIDPVDVGTTVNFVSKTPAYTRVFSLTPRGQGQIPAVTDTGKLVSEYIPQSVDSMIASSQNSLIALYGGSSDYIYFYRTHSDGEQELMTAWFNWKLPGNVLDLVIDSDVMYTVIKQSSSYALLSANLSASTSGEVIVTSSGISINPYLDYYATADSVTYDSATRISKCYLPYTDISSLEPLILIGGNAASNFSTIVESGMAIEPDGRGSDGTGPYFSITGKDLSGQASDVIVGYRFNYDIELPKTYFQLDRGVADYTATLTVSRMKFSVGRSSAVGFKLTSQGYKGSTQTFVGDGSTTAFSPDFKVQDKSRLQAVKDLESYPNSIDSLP